MAAIVVDNIFKSYTNVDAVRGVSFEVHENEIFGLLGPNGAGKSTTIRMLLDFIKPDSGSISIFGERFSEKTKESIGYLPEERGLYDEITVMDNLVYLASLKGADSREAGERALRLLDRAGIGEKADAKVKQLSKGLRQLVQLCATLIHEPGLLILDEPFSGLDPTNRELVKEMIREQKNSGKTIILSTHMMNEVEELCDRVLMINNGRRVLYGHVSEVKETYSTHCVFLEFEGTLPELEGVEKANVKNCTAELYLRIDVMPQDILKQLVERNVTVRRFDVKELSLNDVFIKVAEAEKWIKQ
jgi:ABC-2 type transport system ATP-binding protein